MHQSRAITAILFLFSAIFLANCSSFQDRVVKGSGNIQTESRDIEPFDQLILRGPIDVYLKQGDDHSLTIEAEDNIMPYVETSQERGLLTISIEYPEEFQWVTPTKPIKATLVASQIFDMEINGEGEINAEGVWKFEDLKIAINGSGDIRMSLEGRRLLASITGSGDIILNGEVDTQEYQISGSGDVKSGSLISNKTRIEINGSGDVSVNVRDDLDIVIRGSGEIRYSGNPSVKQKVMGTGTIIQNN